VYRLSAPIYRFHTTPAYSCGVDGRQNARLVNKLKRIQSKAAHEFRRKDDNSLDVSELGMTTVLSMEFPSPL
jgi:hypothetical protein